MQATFYILGFLLIFGRFVYWITLAFRGKNNWKVYLSQILEGILLFFIFSQYFGGVKVFPFENSPLSTLLGFLLILIGVALSFISQKKLGDSWTHAASPKAKKLITTGIYKYIRHPIYFGFILSFLGSEILAGSLLWVSFLFLFIPAYYQVKKEDKLLKDKFGNKFLQYKKNTKMFIPFIF